MERNDAITTLEVLKANCSKHSRDYQALDYAISSLKTDEAYQIMYEGVEIYDKDTVAWMFRELQLDIEKHTMTSGVTNQSTWNECIACCSRVIQQKIKALEKK